MDDEFRFVLKRFAQYYSKAKFGIPEIEKREFGYGTEKKIDARHKSFQNEQDFQAFLANSTPLYVSHSVAYYELPNATPMEKKGWLGADLVFDLDYEAEGKYLTKDDFEKIRGDTLRLIEEFLIPDFGVQKEMISANFSGNRGFHVHVYDKRFRLLRSDERKEIIEYVKGLGLKYEMFFSQKEAGQSAGRSVFKELGPKPDSSGYSGRFARKVLQMLENEPEKLSRIFKDSIKQQSFINNINNGNWSLRKLNQNINSKLRVLAEQELPMRSVNIDSGVTQDASKLIRVPNSIHGSTGLIAKRIPLNELAAFEAMNSAIVFSKMPVKILALDDIPSIEMGNTTHEEIKKSKSAEVPEYFAFFLKLKGSANIIL
ncbi:DNA primase catalytic subunit PriS [Candidatus Micrarchaeota archaeon]|nr:DNA primase catalytic subunit PriS [Candidatus Micrarchaeota archaeon]